MRRLAPLQISLIAHGVFALLLAIAGTQRAVDELEQEPVSFEVAELASEREPAEEPEVAGDDAGDSGMPARGERASTPAPAPEPEPAAAPAPAPEPEPAAAPAAAPGSVVGSFAIGGEGGSGIGGRGGGRGRGVGGRGSGRSAPPQVAKVEKKPSKARPARLIYPKRTRPEIPGEVFIVLLTIDEDGYVDGVRLRQGVNPHDDAKALEAVWRFRYAPALDDDGDPISSKILQRFMLER